MPWRAASRWRARARRPKWAVPLANALAMPPESLGEILASLTEGILQGGHVYELRRRRSVGSSRPSGELGISAPGGQADEPERAHDAQRQSQSERGPVERRLPERPARGH